MDSHYLNQNAGNGGAVDTDTMKAFMEGPFIQWVSYSLLGNSLNTAFVVINHTVFITNVYVLYLLFSSKHFQRLQQNSISIPLLQVNFYTTFFKDCKFFKHK